jgi:hypothetical protein
VFIGSDSRGTSGWGDYIDGGHKLVRLHNYVIGYRVSYRTGQLIEHNPDKFRPVETEPMSTRSFKRSGS